ncbi:cysteine peptidase C12 [Heterobasidion irregulare TC 32-1]|uniref:Cysteine peptidase C12 n=1 Tax=Heterobasidion irregulare (strain TC 32-1) TaxID=747525 RepID=W4K032_HETIT|nr:cysteine peptidase C12 [Heterobasidion irregulare TC 32-1]ETW79152.1 cysteine peptidase C12 [Heterobasidion irregulare TC 32-1]
MFEYSDAQLYTQLRYYSHLFDVDKAIRSAASGKRQDDIMALGSLQSELLRRMSRTVEKYLDRNGRRWVDMGSLFSFMKLA